PLVRFEEEPALGSFAPDPVQGLWQVPWFVPADPKEDRARGAWYNRDALVRVVVVVERRRKICIHLPHRGGVDLAGQAPQGRVSIGEDFVRAIPRPPRNGGRGSDEATTVLVRARVATTRDCPAGFPPRHDPADGLPIQGRRRPPTEDYQPGIGHGIAED